MNIKAVTSDTHFGHANIIKYSNRPFMNPDEDLIGGRWLSKEISKKRADEMDSALIKEWNSVITHEDDVILHLGDFSFGNPEKYLERLNGKILFVPGNHDKQMLDYLYKNKRQDRVKLLGNLVEVDLGVSKAVVCHFAMRVWNRSHYGVWHLYGHSHASLDESITTLAIDVGVDAAYKRWGRYIPFKVSSIEAIMGGKTFETIDHNGRLKKG